MALHASRKLAALCAVGILVPTTGSAAAAELPLVANASPSHLEIWAGRAQWTHFALDILAQSADSVTLSTKGGFPYDMPGINLHNGSVWGIPASDSRGLVIRNGSVELENISGAFHLELDLGADYTFWGSCEGTLAIGVEFWGLWGEGSYVPLNVTLAVKAPSSGNGPHRQLTCASAKGEAVPIDGAMIFMEAAAVIGAGAASVIAVRRWKKRDP